MFLCYEDQGITLIWCGCNTSYIVYGELGTNELEAGKKVSRQRPRSAMSWNTLEKFLLEPAALNRLADRKQCTLSTQPNLHLKKWWFIGEFHAQAFQLTRETTEGVNMDIRRNLKLLVCLEQADSCKTGVVGVIKIEIFSVFSVNQHRILRSCLAHLCHAFFFCSRECLVTEC